MPVWARADCYFCVIRETQSSDVDSGICRGSTSIRPFDYLQQQHRYVARPFRDGLGHHTSRLLGCSRSTYDGFPRIVDITVVYLSDGLGRAGSDK